MVPVIALITILALSPLPFGATPPFWQSLLAAVSLFLVPLAYATTRQSRTGLQAWLFHAQPTVRWSAALLAIVVSWMMFQAFVPGPWQHPAWQQVADTIGGPVSATISLDPFATMSDAISLLGIAGIFLVTATLSRDAKVARLVLQAIALIGAAYATYGLLVFALGNETVAWMPKRHYLASLTSTFVNRNSYGVFAGLTGLAALGLLLSYVTPLLSAKMSRRDKTTMLLERLATRWWIWLGAIAVGVTALLLTGSRGATAATGLSMLTLIAVYLGARRAGIAPIMVALFGAGVIGFSILALSGDFVLSRLQDNFDSNLTGRSDIYAYAFATLRDHMWLGTGYGAFEDGFAFYQTGTDAIAQRIVAAHSIYLETAIELGLPAALLFFASVGLLIFTCIKGTIERQRDRIYPALAVAASLLVGTQGIVDFGVQTPAIATLYAALLGIGVAQSTSSRRRR